MTRKRIELHNYDKYQPYFHAPLIDRIEGDAQEMILSADGNEASASGNTVGAMTINSAGGMWVDLGPVTRIHTAYSTDTIAASTGQETVFSMDSQLFNHTTLHVMVSAFDRIAHERIEITHFDTDVDMTRGAKTTSGAGSLNYNITVSNTSGEIQVDLSNNHSAPVNVRVTSCAHKL